VFSAVRVGASHGFQAMLYKWGHSSAPMVSGSQGTIFAHKDNF
jgi:hypothetical protein